MDNTNTMDRLVAAGAPEVVEPHFYRIAHTEEQNLAVELRVRRKRFGSDRVGRLVVAVNPNRPEEVLGNVVDALTAIHAEAARAHSITSLIGEHSKRAA